MVFVVLWLIFVLIALRWWHVVHRDR